jgi:hypothetical protein
MALVVADRVQETTTTIGTGTITLAGAVSGFQSFATIGNANTTYYCVTSGADWEVGIGTYTSAGTTLARTTILASSAAGAAITLAGTSNVFCVYPAGKSIYQNDQGSVGIGTNAPLQFFSVYDCLTLEVNTAAGHDTSLLRLYEPNNGVDFRLAATGPNIQALIGTYSAVPLVFYADSAEAMRITATGRLGIGTTNPTTPLHVIGTITATTFSGAGSFTTLSASSTVSGAGFSTYLASPPAIGGTAAAAGTFTTLIANTSASVGSAAPAGTNFYNNKTLTGNANPYSNRTVATVQTDATGSARGYVTSIGVVAAHPTLSSLQHFLVTQASFNASTVTTQVGFYVNSTLVGASTNYAFNADDLSTTTGTAYGFYSNVNTSGTGTVWGFYANGTANNLFRGNTYHGNTAVTPTAKIHVAAGSATASTAPLKFTSGTNLTAVEAGVVEYDGTIMTATPNANFKRGTIPITNYTSGVGVSLTAAAEATLQDLLPAANDTITLSIGTYFLDLACTFTRGTVSTTSAQAQINILGTGGAVGSFSGMSLSSPTAGGATANFAFNAVNINVSNVVTAASTTISGVYTITLRGMLKITTAGTVDPQYNLSANLTSAGTATAPNVLYFRLQQIDTQSAAAFGPAGTGWG